MINFDISKINGLTQDSRHVKDGYLFAAFKGEKTDGRDYIGDAVKNGAHYILAEPDTEIEGEATLIASDNPRLDFAKLVALFYPRQPSHFAAVTGTNGKTSTVFFLEQLWRSGGFKAASLGTLSGAMTTPDPVTLHEMLNENALEAVNHVAMEASSHGLDQYRLHGADIRAAGFTNLSRDHLDYHNTMEDYLDAKLKLFSEVLDEDGIAVLNRDIPEFERLKAAAGSRRIIEYGHNAEHIRLVTRAVQPRGQTLALGVMGNPYTIDVPLVGEFQIMNALCALGLAIALDPEKTEIYLETLSYIKSPPGRLQPVLGHPKGAGIYVDYAHTPDALENVLIALRPHTQGKLICLFGCGGDRDAGKRPEMGTVAGKHADHIIITDDNPRSEDPAEIRTQILQTCPSEKTEEIGDRAEAIMHAVKMLGSGDVLVIAGKGHEQGQIFADQTIPFEDAEAAAKALKNLNIENFN